MRLVCPNCDAKYEVPEDAIPDAGRDVQCANCSHAWFQTRERTASTPVVASQPEPAAEPATAPEAIPAAAEAEPTAAEPSVAVEAAAEVAAQPEITDFVAKSEDARENASPSAEPPSPETEPTESDPATATLEPEGNAPSPEPVMPEPVAAEPESVSAKAEPKHELKVWPELAEEVDPAVPIAARAVDEGVLTILREEAEREAKARRADGQSHEGQADPGDDAAAVARKKGAGKKSAAEPLAAAKSSTRRDLLPDVEEINSTLRPSDLPEAEFVGDPGAVARDGRGAFRSGFLLVLSAAILGGAIYIASGWLASMIPALEEPLKVYVGLIDGVRLFLDSLMQSATRLISGEPG